jgi:ATP-dependent RNA helicase DeaD
VNSTRLARFDDSITAALADPEQIQQFRDIVGHYVGHHDVPEADVAAALAVVAQGDTPLLLSAEAERAQRFDRFDSDDRQRSERPDRGRGDRPERGRRDDRDRGDRGSSGDRPDRSPRGDGGPKTTYRIAVGKRQKVEPRQIVGAIANEGGLGRGDFGAIQIRPDFSLVELPANLSDDVLRRLENTRISGKLIELRPDRTNSAKREDRPPRSYRD